MWRMPIPTSIRIQVIDPPKTYDNAHQDIYRCYSISTAYAAIRLQDGSRQHPLYRQF